MTKVFSRGSGGLLIRQRLNAVEASVENGVRRGLVAGGARVEATAKNLVRQPGQGRVYTHYLWTDNQGRLRKGRERPAPHRASAPGDPPASDTGRLMGSIQSGMVGDGFRNEVTAATEYARWLEFGTLKMAARPFMKPAIDQNRKPVLKILIQEIRRALRGRLGR